MDPLPTVDVRTRLESATSTSVLESPNIVREEVEAKSVRFSGTVWDTPEEREKMQNENGVDENGKDD